MIASPLPGAPLDLSIAAESVSVSYREQSDSGTTLNREDGRIPGLSLRAGTPLVSGVALGLSLSHHRGDLAYAGETQSGASLATDTRTRFSEMGMSVDYSGYWSDLEWTLGPELRFRQWVRDIQPTPNTVSLETRYRWWMPGLSLGARKTIANGQTLSLDLGVFATRRITARVDLSNAGLGRVKLEPESDHGHRLALSWLMPFSDDRALFATFFFEKLAFSPSSAARVQSGNRVFSVNEPASTSWRRGIGIGVRF